MDRSRWFKIARIAIGILLIIFILYRIDLGRFLQLIKGVQLNRLLLAFIPYFFFVLLSSWRWKILLDYQGFELKFFTLFKYYLISLLFGQALPTTVGGDVIRVLYLKDRKADALAVVVMDRLIGFLGLFIFALCVTLIIYLIRRETFFLKFILIGIILILVIIGLLLSRRIFAVFSKILAKIKILSLGERANRIYGIINEFRAARKEIFLCLILSFMIQASLAIGPFLVHLALPLKSISIGYFLLCVPLINIIAMIPISPGALGVRESSFVFFFPKFGLTEPSAFAISLLAKFVEILFYLIGGTIFYFRKK